MPKHFVMDQALGEFLLAAIAASVACGILAYLIMTIHDRLKRRNRPAVQCRFPEAPPAATAELRRHLMEDIHRAEKWVAILPDDLDWRVELEIRQQVLREFDERQGKGPENLGH